MPHLKTAVIQFNNGVEIHSMKVKISVSSNGEFYCHAPDHIADAVENHFSHGQRENVNATKGTIKLSKPSLRELEDALYECLSDSLQPEIIIEYVIRYNVESKVAFAETPEGEIFPNAGFPNAQWRENVGLSNKMYGGLNTSMHRSAGGYGLQIGAQALTKTITRFGKKERASYSTYHKGDSHSSHDNPATLLNSWTCFSLDVNKSKEMPYTDEAATFFHELMLGMAKLSKMIQSHTFDEVKLLETIASGSNLIGHKK